MSKWQNVSLNLTHISTDMAYFCDCHLDKNGCSSLRLESPELEQILNESSLLWLQNKTLTSAGQSRAQELQALILETLEKN